MKPRYRALAALVSVVLGFSLVFAFGGPALAFSTPVGPSSGNLQDYLVGVPSSVLSGAETSPLEGAQSAALAPGGTSTDFDEWEQEMAEGSTDTEAFGPPIAAPAAPVAAGGALLVVSAAWSMRGGIVDGIYGTAADQEICNTQANGQWTNLISQFEGVSCSAQMTGQAGSYVPNTDAPSALTGGESCATSSDGGYTSCVQLVSTLGVGTNAAYCYEESVTGPEAEGQTVYIDAGGSASGYGVVTFPRNYTDSNRSYCPGGELETYPLSDFYDELGQYSSMGSLEGYCAATSYPPSGAVTLQEACASAGNPVETPQTTTSDPERTIECEVTGSDGNAYTASSQPFQESSGVWPQIVCPTLPSGVQPFETQYIEQSPGLPDQVLQTIDADPAFKNWATTYPQCTTGGCTLDVTSKLAVADCNTTPDWVSSVDSTVSCADWFTDPNRDADWQCVYGGTDVDISECNVLSNFYNPTALSSGTLYADPNTGELPSGSTSTAPGTLPSGTPVANPENSRSCWSPSGWGVANPLNWVLQPVMCALQWAFVPRQSVIKADGKSFKKAVQASAVGSAIGILVGMSTFPITGNGCSGIPWEFKIFSIDQTYYLLAACPGDPLAPTAGVVKTILTAVVITIGVLTSVRYIANIFGYIGFGGMVDADRREAYIASRREAARVRFK